MLQLSTNHLGPITTLALLGYVGDCSRFSKVDQISYYVGLVPRVDISGDFIHYGRILKRGCIPIRRCIIQGAWSLVKSNNGGALKEFYLKLKIRKGGKKAIVATARKMLEVFYVMIKTGEMYRDMPDETLKKKLLGYGLI